jgi:hypothetical protein
MDKKKHVNVKDFAPKRWTLMWRGSRGKLRIAALSVAQKPISALQFAACPEFSPDFLPSAVISQKV